MASRKVYFWHEDTNEVVWTPPAGGTPRGSTSAAASQPDPAEPAVDPGPHTAGVQGLAAAPDPQLQPEAAVQTEDGELGPQPRPQPEPEPDLAAVGRLAGQLAHEVQATLGPLPTILHLLAAACSLSGAWGPSGQAALAALRRDTAAVAQQIPQLRQELAAWVPHSVQARSSPQAEAAGEQPEPGQLPGSAPHSPSEADMDVDPPAPSDPASPSSGTDAAAPPLPQEASPVGPQLPPREASGEPPLPEDPPEALASPPGSTSGAAAASSVVARPVAANPVVRGAAVMTAPRQLSPPPAAHALDAAISLSPPRQLTPPAQVPLHAAACPGACWSKSHMSTRSITHPGQYMSEAFVCLL